MCGVNHTLEGRWQMVRAELSGEAAPELMAEQTNITLAGGAYEVRFGGEISDRGTYAEQASEPFHSLVLRGVVGPNAGRTIPCIFQLVGDRLRVCYGLDGVLPTSFATRAEEPRYLVTYRRIGAEGA